jgi:F-type H+-transporting ATPase subunit a
MEHHEFFVSTVFNEYIAYPLVMLLGLDLETIQHWFSVHGEHEVLPPHLVMAILVSLGLILFAWLVRRRLSVDSPGALQQSLEVVFEAIMGFMKDLIGPHYQRFFPIVGTLFFYIWVGNVMGLFPGFMSPTSNINVTAGCAIIVFFYYNYHGIRAHGFWKYMAHFAGPALAIAPLLFVIEIISHLARPFSLSVRLFGNIFAEELIIASLNSLFPFLLSLPLMGLALFAGTIQAFIFIVLTMVYIAGAVEHSHEDEHAADHVAAEPDLAEAA